jgi:hypothetical protein
MITQKKGFLGTCANGQNKVWKAVHSNLKEDIFSTAKNKIF